MSTPSILSRIAGPALLLLFVLLFETESAQVDRAGLSSVPITDRSSGLGRRSPHSYRRFTGIGNRRSDRNEYSSSNVDKSLGINYRSRAFRNRVRLARRVRMAHYLSDRQSTDENVTSTAPPQPDTNSSAEEPSLEANMTEAFEDFKLYYLEEGVDDSSDAFQQVLVFDKGALVGPFERNPSNFTASSLKSEDKSDWFTEKTVTDRIAFQFHFNPDYLYFLREPELTVSDDSRVEPEVVDFQMNDDSGTGSFNIVYHCVMGKPGQAVVSMHLMITEGHSVRTAWVKECGQGRFAHLSFGFVNHQGDTIEFNADGTYGSDERKTLEVGPMDSPIDLVVGLTPPATNLDFLTPYVSSDNDEVYVTLRSTVRSGRFSSDIETKFTVIHDCERKSVAKVTFTVAIPPWDNLTATWRKDCGGDVSQSLLVGTEGEDSYDVIQEGSLLPEYKVTESTTVDSVDSKVKVIPVGERSVKFFLTNADDTSDIHFQTISTTLSDPDVLHAFVGTDEASSLNANGGVLERDSVRTLLILFVCKRVGKSVVLITLPSVRYATAEFGFVKECDGAPMTYTHSGFLSTAGSLLDVILVLAFISGIALCVYTAKKKSEARYQAVPTSEEPTTTSRS